VTLLRPVGAFLVVFAAVVWAVAARPAIARPAAAAGAERPPPSQGYGFVVDNVNVSVLLYVPVRSASFAPMCCLNATATGSLLIGPL